MANVQAYVARAMSGRNWKAVVEEARADMDLLESRGVRVSCPVLTEYFAQEGVITPDKDLSVFFKRDKKMIREAHVLINATPARHSHGVSHEVGYARYGLWMPVIHVFKGGLPESMTVAHLEGDVIVESMIQAAYEIQYRWGTWGKRFRWRLKMYLRSWPKHLWRKLRMWK